MKITYRHTDDFMYAAPLNNALYCRHMLRTVARFSLAHSHLSLLADTIDKNSKLTNAEITNVFDGVYDGVSRVYASRKTDGARLISELVAPVNPDIAKLFTRLIRGLQHSCVFLNYAVAGLHTEDTHYALAASMIALCQYDDFKYAVADAMADITGNPAVYMEDKLALQSQLSRHFFGLGWETLYASQAMSPEDIIRNVLQLRPPFVGACNIKSELVSMPADFDVSQS